MNTHTFSRTLLMLMIAGVVLSGCEKNQPNKSLPAQTVAKQYQQATTLHGTVSNNQGFAEKGTVKVTSVGGELISSTTLLNSKNYSVEIPAQTPLPVLLNFTGEDGENFIAVVIHPSITKYDISPHTTAIAKKAMSLGGYTDSNLRQAAESTVSVPDADKTSAGFRGDPTQHYGGWH